MCFVIKYFCLASFFVLLIVVAYTDSQKDNKSAQCNL